VTSVTPLERGAARGAAVAYVRRATARRAANPLVTDADLRAACDSTARWSARAVLVLDSAGWRLNHPPAFDEPPNIKTQYEYDHQGRLWGARSTATFAGPRRDPDGDSVTVHWYAPGDTVPQVIAAGPDGFQVSVKHLIIMGRPQSAHGRLIISDTWGVADTMSVGVTFR
jgi:YD repeat-containing protein